MATDGLYAGVARRRGLRSQWMPVTQRRRRRTPRSQLRTRGTRVSTLVMVSAVGRRRHAAAAQPRWVRTSWIDVGKVRLLIPPSASRGARGRVVLRRPRAARPRGTGRSEARGQGPGSNLYRRGMIAGSPRLPVPVFAVVSLYYASDLTRPAHRAARATANAGN